MLNLVENDPMTWENCFVIRYLPGDTDHDSPCIHDVCRHRLAKCFLETLCQEGYYTHLPTPDTRSTILDLAAWLTLYPTDRDDRESSEVSVALHRQDWCAQQNYGLLLDIQSHYLNALELLSKHSTFRNSIIPIPGLIRYVQTILGDRYLTQNRTDIALRVLTIGLTVVTVETDPCQIQAILNYLIENNSSHLTVLMLTARNHPTALIALLEFLTRHIELLDSDAPQALLLEKSNDGANTLRLVARCQPALLIPLLEWNTPLRTQWSPEAIRQLVSTMCSHWDVLEQKENFSPLTRKSFLRLVACASKQPKDLQLVANILFKELDRLDLTDRENKDLLDGLCRNPDLSKLLLKRFSACNLRSVQNLVVVTRALLDLYKAEPYC